VLHGQRVYCSDSSPLPSGGAVSSTVGSVPSYRVRMVPGLVRPGVDPADVLPAAQAAAAELTAVEAGQIDIVRGTPRVTVRFEAADDVAASGIGRAVVARVEELVDVEVSRVTRRWGARWYPLR
jgi:hypothetical protein